MEYVSRAINVSRRRDTLSVSHHREVAKFYADADANLILIIRAGLNPGDEVRYGITENPEHPGAYQWEALDDPTAGTIITRAIAPYVDFTVMAEIERHESAMTRRFRDAVSTWLADLAPEGDGDD